MSISEVRREPQPLTHEQIWGDEETAPAPDALGCTCPDCHAPEGVGCVTIVWKAHDGKFEPSYQPRDPHNRRRKRLEKFGPEASKRA